MILIEKTVTILCSLEVGSLEPKNEPSFNFQYFDPQFARTGLYIYMYILYLQATYMQLYYSIKRIIGPTNHVYIHTLTYIQLCKNLPLARYSLYVYYILFFLRDPVIIKGSSSYFIRLVRSRSRFIYAQNRDVSSMCGLLLKFGWQRTMVWFLS